LRERKKGEKIQKKKITAPLVFFDFARYTDPEALLRQKRKI